MSPATLSIFTLASAPTLPSGRRIGFMSSTSADARAALADLVAGQEVRAVGDAELQLRRGDERQALVRVVGEEDRDHGDERGHGPDEDRVRNDGSCSAAPQVVAKVENWAAPRAGSLA